MASGAHASDNGRPGKRRDRRSNTDALPHRPGGNQPRKRRQLPGVEERMDHFPVGRIPADQEHAFTVSSHRGKTFGVSDSGPRENLPAGRRGADNSVARSGSESLTTPPPSPQAGGTSREAELLLDER